MRTLLMRTLLIVYAAWHTLSGEEFATAVDAAYDQIVHWKSNLFKVPSGASGKRFVGELARLFSAFATESTLEAIAIKAAMTMPALLLQKPHAKSKTREHITCLSRRLELWGKGDIKELLREGRVIQRQLPTPSPKGHANKDTAHKFSNLIMNGKVRNALRLLTPNSNSGFLSLDQVTAGGQSVKDILQEKHPDANPAHPEALSGVLSRGSI